MEETGQCSLNCRENTAGSVNSKSGRSAETFLDRAQKLTQDYSQNITRIKICGLSRPEDVAYVNEALPDYCGFIINFPKSHRNVTPDKVRSLVKGLDKRICPVGVFVNQPIETVLSLAADGTLGAVQLHGNETQEYVEELKSRLAETEEKEKNLVPEKGGKLSGRGIKPNGENSVPERTEEFSDPEMAAAGKRILVIQAFAIHSENDTVRAGNSAADYILLDRGTGTGQTFDWGLIRRINRPFFLAGGLGPDNLAEAVGQLHPFAVDMSSGVETGKIKDREKILRAVSIIRDGRISADGRRQWPLQ